MTFDQIHVPEDADDAMEWACFHEFDLRHRRMVIAREGLAGVIKRTNEALNKFHMALDDAYRGDRLLR